MMVYNSHQHIPPWIENMDGQLLTPTELDVLDFIHYCRKHGCRTSNDFIGAYTHKSHNTVQRAIMRLYLLQLVTIENFGKRTRKIRPVPWPGRDSWKKYAERTSPPSAYPAHHGPHITHINKTTTLTGSSLCGCNRNPPLADGNFPSDAGGLSGSREGGIASPSYQLTALAHRDKLVHNGWPLDQADRLALVKFPKATFSEDLSDGTETKS